MNRLFGLLALGITGCGVGSADVTVADDDRLTDEALLVGDSADRSCQVTLRSVGRVAGATGGFATRCSPNGPCYFIWEGVIDVAATAKAGSKPWVLYRSTDATVWSKKVGTAIAGGPAGYQRYKFRLETNTVSAGMSATSLQRARLELSPYLRLPDGTRLFDHNRLPGELDVTALTANNAWALSEDPAVCRPVGQSRATLKFNGDWSEEQHGALVANGKGVIEFDLSRLTACRGTHNGYPAFDLTAIVRFSPGNQQVEQSVRTFDAPGGVPSFSTLRAQPFEFTVPSGTTAADVWFVNTGLSCSPSYDSNNGSNYRFDVIAQPAKVGWFGNTLASTSRACVADQSVPASLTLDGYIRERACSFIEAQVYVPGLTDAAALRPELVLARAEATLDGVALPAKWMTFQGRTGNDYRFRYELPRDTLYYGAKWSTLKYTLAYSTDGVIWSRDVERTVVRDPSWCNPSWGSCGL